MTKKLTTVYNKSSRTFVLGKDLIIKPNSHNDVPADLAKSVCEKYKKELSTVKVQGSSNNGDLVKFEASKAAFNAEKEAFEKAKAEFEEEKELFELEKAEFEKKK